MGWCHEFGPQISETCEHPMTAGATSCSCTVCGTVCTGRFAGCAAVWARGPREVAVDAPHASKADFSLHTDRSPGAEADRWRLPLDPLQKPMAPASQAVKTFVPAAESEHEPEVVPPAAINGNGASSAFAADAPTAESGMIATTIESPDITARFAVAQLAELNERVESLTKLATETTETSLEKVHSELRRITSLREVDLTEQAAGIFGAVQAGTDALESFATVVREVTDDLREILRDSLAAIGGTEGLAHVVAEAQADVAGVREDFGAALARIERDLAVMRQRIPAKAPAATQPQTAKVSAEQIDYIVDAVTEAVLGTLNAEKSGRRR
ncbi:MAG: hypothetical protein Q8K63_02910 [Acidimicrobiales bacterium]|nr:hypothetical protein [Acidimicrobiales bacterium]